MEEEDGVKKAVRLLRPDLPVLLAFLARVGVTLLLPIYASYLLAFPISENPLIAAALEGYRAVGMVPIFVVVIIPDMVADALGLYGAVRAIFLYVLFVAVSYALALVIGRGGERLYSLVRG